MCPAPGKALWSAGCCPPGRRSGRCLHMQEMFPSWAGPGALRLSPGEDRCAHHHFTNLWWTQECSILENEGSSPHLSPDRNDLSEQKSPLQTKITSPICSIAVPLFALHRGGAGFPRDSPGLLLIHFGSWNTPEGYEFLPTKSEGCRFPAGNVVKKKSLGTM